MEHVVLTPIRGASLTLRAEFQVALHDWRGKAYKTPQSLEQLLDEAEKLKAWSLRFHSGTELAWYTKLADGWNKL